MLSGVHARTLGIAWGLPARTMGSACGGACARAGQCLVVPAHVGHCLGTLD